MTDKKRILVADDDEQSLGLFVLLIKSKTGLEVIGASDGQKALEAVRTFKPDLVLSDIEMPLVNGFGLFLILEKELGKKMPKFIFMSGSPNNFGVSKFLGSQFLQKPFAPDDMFRLFNELLN